MSTAKSTTNVPAFARALLKVLSVSQFDARRSYQPPPGEWIGPVRELWWDLQEQAAGWIRDICDRPHETTELRRELKKHAVSLHRDHGIVVTLDGRQVKLKLLRGKQ